MWSRVEIKTNAKNALKNYFGTGLLAIIIYIIVLSFFLYIINVIYETLANVFAIHYVSLYKVINGYYSANLYDELTVGIFIILFIKYALMFVYEFLVGLPLMVGIIRFYQKSRGAPASLNEMFVPMEKFLHVSGVMVLMGIKIFLWSLLLIIPGIIKAYEYSMVPFILAENPEMSTKRAFQISKAMTNGHKWDLFVLGLSFILWFIGCIFTCGLLFIYVSPYIYATRTEAYYKLKSEAVFRGEINPMELPDIYMPPQPPVPPVPPTAPTMGM